MMWNSTFSGAVSTLSLLLSLLSSTLLAQDATKLKKLVIAPEETLSSSSLEDTYTIEIRHTGIHIDTVTSNVLCRMERTDRPGVLTLEIQSRYQTLTFKARGFQDTTFVVDPDRWQIVTLLVTQYIEPPLPIFLTLPLPPNNRVRQTFAKIVPSGFEDTTGINRERSDSLYISLFEVTNSQFCQFLNKLSQQNPRELDSLFSSRDCRIMREGDTFAPASLSLNRHPVVGVTWYGARRFVEWLQTKTGLECRLPTEDEWKHLARYASHDSHNRVVQAKWGTSPVDSLNANAMGLRGLHGNVREWLQGEPKPGIRAIGGSSYLFTDGKDLGASFIDGAPPMTTSDALGFRVVVPINEANLPELRRIAEESKRNR